MTKGHRISESNTCFMHWDSNPRPFDLQHRMALCASYLFSQKTFLIPSKRVLMKECSGLDKKNLHYYM